MNYNEFLKMIPEAFLVLALIVVFFGDFCLHKSEQKNAVLSKLTGVLLLAQIFVCLYADAEYAFVLTSTHGQKTVGGTALEGLLPIEIIAVFGSLICICFCFDHL